MKKVIYICIILSIFCYSTSYAQTLAPDGSYVGGDDYTLAPDGSYVSDD